MKRATLEIRNPKSEIRNQSEIRKWHDGRARNLRFVFRISALLVLAVFLALAVIGCGPPRLKTETKSESTKDNPLELAREVLLRGSELASYKNAVELLNGYLAEHPDALAEYQPKLD